MSASAVLRTTTDTGRLTPVQRVQLGFEILASYVHVRRLLWRTKNDLPSVLAAIREQPERLRPRLEPDTLGSSLRLGSAVGRTLNLMPADARCLVRSLVLTRLLTRRGIGSVFVIGVNADPADFGAHAWVERDGLPLLPPSDFKKLAEL